ncbi:hypothetical protein RB595_000613 [Gaeumannomyces hyphopodioides]
MDPLQPPRKGRSRFSKALPAPPPLEGFNSNFDDLEHMFRPRTAASTSTSLANAVPTPPPKASQLPPPPPPPTLDSPLQRQMLVSPKTPGPPPPMTIPRRPVALPSSPAPLPNTPRPSPKPPITTAPPARTPVGKLSSPSLPAPPAAPLDDEPPSPANSILSLLSAYSRSTSGSAAQRSSEATVSTKASSAFVPQSPPSAKKAISPFTLPPLDFGEPSSSESMASFGQPPTPPMKDTELSLPPPPPKDKDVARPGWFSSSSPQQPTSTATAAQPQSQEELELWRRRSGKTDKHIEVSELKLGSSHGSTAASAEVPVPPPKEQRPEPPSKSQFLQTATSSLAAAGPLSADLNSKRLPPRSPAGGLPGRNIRPNPTAETLTQNDDTTMGSALSKAEAKMKHRRPSDGEKPAVNGSADVARPRPDDDGSSRLQQPQSQPPSNLPAAAKSPVVTQHPSTIRRLPTPDYEQHDIRSPIVEQIVSPVSPVSPASSPDLAPQQPVPRKPLPSAIVPIEASAAQRKGVPSPISTAPPASSNAGPGRMGGNFSSFPKSPDARLKPKPSNATLVERPAPSPGAAAPPAPVTGLGLQQPLQPHYKSLLSPTVDTTPVDGNQTQFPARTSSRGAELPTSPILRLPAEQPALALDTESVSESIVEAYFSAPNSPSTVRAQPPPQQQYQQPPPGSRSSDSSSFKELVQTDDFNPAAARFPSMAAAMGPTPAAGTVFQMRGLKPSHWGCVHKHRFMAPTPNSNYPLACQTCAREDAEDRFRCRFCWLRVCVPCKDVLGQNKGDLGALMARVKEAGGQPMPAATAVHKSGGAFPNGMPGSPVIISPMSPQAAY